MYFIYAFVHSCPRTLSLSLSLSHTHTCTRTHTHTHTHTSMGACTQTNVLSGRSLTQAQWLLSGPRESFLWSPGDLLCPEARSHPAWPQGCTAGPFTPRLVSNHLREKVSPAPSPGSFRPTEAYSGSLVSQESSLRVGRGGPGPPQVRHGRFPDLDPGVSRVTTQQSAWWGTQCILDIYRVLSPAPSQVCGWGFQAQSCHVRVGPRPRAQRLQPRATPADVHWRAWRA